MDKIKAPKQGERTLPPYYYSVADEKLCNERLSSGLAALNDALDKLLTLLDKMPNSEEPTRITEKDISAIYDKKISSCKELPLPKDVITQTVTEWELEKNTALSYVRQIYKSRKDLEALGAKIEFDEPTATITNKNEITKEAGKVYISDVDKELWRLLCNVRDSYRRYSTYADKHNKRSRLGIGQILSVSTPEQFVKEVALGHFDRFPTDMQLFRDNPDLVPTIKTKSNLVTHEN